ncbi:MAG TPA: BTAD domain-containing putative transcriptional regulator [Geminicoccus sp.]|uniref:BTAD domain-containing putative transcriptional regulator n=1 Tax=Geminicoccus sp. TaxID=2024832 RepID=UPI002E2F40DA|nr:BTAD domain-containing putative transcriptional regulator [Geminicoccus sp.]HEX2525172.1 BTAD domain-containing putative transcriptional regulator [Geminicoccus sp.]
MRIDYLLDALAAVDGTLALQPNQDKSSGISCCDQGSQVHDIERGLENIVHQGPAAAQPVLPEGPRFECLGSTRLVLSDGTVLVPRLRKTLALLLVLVRSHPKPIRRARLTAMLWSESDQERASSSLRQCLGDLRKIMGDGHGRFFSINDEQAAVRSPPLQVDLLMLNQMIDEADVPAALRLLKVSGPTLAPDLAEIDPEFDSWLDVERELHASELCDRLVSLADGGAVSDKDRLAIADAAAKLNEYREDVVALRVRSLVALGRRAEAIDFFDAFRDNQRREYGINPRQELTRLVQDLVRATGPVSGPEPQVLGPAPTTVRAAEPHAGPQLVRQDRPRLAVTVADRKLLARGSQAEVLARELITSLSRFRDWTVVLVPEGLEQDVAALSSRGIDFLVEVADLTLPRRKLSFQVVVRLTSTSEVIEAFSRDVERATWASARNEFVARLAGVLNATIHHARMFRIRLPQDQSAGTAFEHWLEARQLMNLWRVDAEEHAITLLEKAVSRDPQLACAHGSLAGIFNSRWMFQPGKNRSNDDLVRAAHHARRAVQLDPFDGRNHLHLAWTHVLAGRCESAAGVAEQALALNPASMDALISVAIVLSFCGHHERAVQLGAQALEYQPYIPEYYWGYWASICFLAGRYRDCAAAVDRAPECFPDIQAWAAAAYALLGQGKSAALAHDRLLGHISPLWQGDAPCHPAPIREWILSMFPIQLDKDRAMLRQGLEQAEQDKIAMTRAR